MAFANSSWTDLVVWFGLPWLVFLFAALFVSGSNWEDWYQKLKRPSMTVHRRYFRHVGFAACTLLGLAGFLTQHFGDATQSPMHLGLTFHLIQFVFACAWMLLFFDYHYLWISTVVAVAALVSTSIAFIACAIAVSWTLFGYLPYWILVAAGTATTGVIAYENQAANIIAIQDLQLPGASSSGSATTTMLDDAHGPPSWK